MEPPLRSYVSCVLAETGTEWEFWSMDFLSLWVCLCFFCFKLQCAFRLLIVRQANLAVNEVFYTWCV